MLTGLAAGSAAAGPLGPIASPATLLAAYSPTRILDTAFDGTAASAPLAGTDTAKPPWSYDAGRVAGLSLLGPRRLPIRPGLSAAMTGGRLRLSAVTCTGGPWLKTPAASCTSDLSGAEINLPPRPGRRALFSSIGITLRF